MVAISVGAPRRKTGSFYVWIAAACALIAFGGFLPTYWLQLPAHSFIGPPLLHLHALLASAWILFLLSQTVLAARGQMRHHRAWGMAGIALASALFVISIAAATYSLQQGLGQGYGDRSRAFFIVPVSEIVMFAGFFTAAVATINRPEAHKRLVLLSTIAILPAAAARVVFTLAVGHGPGMRPGLGQPPPVTFVLLPALLLELLIVAGMIYDWRKRGRPHGVWWIGLGVITAVTFGIVPFSQTPLWLGFAEAMAHITG